MSSLPDYSGQIFQIQFYARHVFVAQKCTRIVELGHGREKKASHQKKQNGKCTKQKAKENISN